ncbi:MAG: repeat protein [Myxococcaceae bacterium]|nr:repeat protein [Myxococcaceae bacterium]
MKRAGTTIAFAVGMARTRTPRTLALVAVTTLLGALMIAESGCSSTTEDTAQSSAAVDTICGEAPSASIDGIPAYAYCGNFNVFSNNGVDTRSYGGPGWVQTEAGYGYQCFELASRYMHFKWGVSANWGVLYASEMCNVHPPGVSVTTNPVHGDLAVFPGGRCGVAAPAGHVAVVDTVGATSFRAVQQNVATSLSWPYGCQSCFLHAAANGGASDPCSISLATGYNCGATSQFPGGAKDTLYYCAGGATKSTSKCAAGCSLQPPGVSDKCNDPPTPPPPPPPLTPPVVYPKLAAKSAVDVNGDGRGDVCARGVAGLSCALSNSVGFPTEVATTEFSNDKGWAPDEYGTTIQFADVDGDGKADVCGRGGAGITCSLSTGAGFAAPIAGPAWADKSGWNRPEYYTTIQFADVNGDGKADVCGRDAGGISCVVAAGAGKFGDGIRGPAWSDASGFNKPEHYSSIQFADVNGDGKADVCGRDADGIVCGISDGTSLTTLVRGPAWSDAANWNHPEYTSTIRFVDIDGDHKADVCGRAAAGISCSLSTGTGFGPEVKGPAWSDASGWSKPEYYRTIQFGDVNGDGKADLCGRAAVGLFCELSDGKGFPTEVKGPAWSDAQGFAKPQYYTTLGTVDVNDDGLDDVCVRTANSVSCALSTGTAFGEPLAGPAWADASGWGVLPYYASLSYVGSARPHSSSGESSGGTSAAGTPVNGEGGSVGGAPDATPTASDGCSVSTSRTTDASGKSWSLLGVALAFLSLRRRR